MQLPRVYPIADGATLTARGISLEDFVRQLVSAGAEIVQLRDKESAPEQVLRHAAAISKVLRGERCLPVMNDWADLAMLAGWQAVHVGHRDLPPEAVRRVLGEQSPAAVVGVSTHDERQVIQADRGSADYIAVGPVFATGTKADAEPVIGLEGVRRARQLTRKPLVAIGGITRANAAEVWRAGADSIAVIGSFFAPGESVERVMQDFLVRSC